MTGKYTIINGDITEILKDYAGALFHAQLSDPPYHLTSITERFSKEDSAPAKYGTDGVFQRASKGFMGQSWEVEILPFDPETWKIIADVLYPGAFGMAFASSRGWHRLAVGIEDGGNIIHPSIFGWVQGQGFPKATRIDTQIGKAAGAERNKVFRPRPDGKKNGHGGGTFNACDVALDYESAKTPLAQVWQGHRYGAQALRPALEPIIVFQKPYSARPIDNITQSGAGALNIDGGRIKTNDSLGGGAENSPNAVVNEEGWDPPWMHDPNMLENHTEKIRNNVDHAEQLGRWPANFILSHHPDRKLIGTKNIKGYTINRCG